MLKYFIYKNYKFALPILFLIVAFVFIGMKQTSYADTPSGVAYCFLEQTGITYQCGPGGPYGFTGTPDQTTQPYGNDCSVLPIFDTSGTQYATGCGSAPNTTNPPYYEFKVGKCYIEGVNSNGVDVWTEQKDCTSGDFSNPASITTSMPSDITNYSTDTAVGNCGLDGSNCDLVAKYINPIINFLAGAVGIVVVISVVMGGIQYSASGDNPQAAAAAKKRIGNALLAAIAFLFLWGFLQFIVPGGLLK
jgi:hypothetical protein